MQVESNWPRSCRHSWTGPGSSICSIFAIHLLRTLGFPGFTESRGKARLEIGARANCAARKSCAEKHEIAEICTIFLGERTNNDSSQIIFALLAVTILLTTGNFFGLRPRPAHRPSRAPLFGVPFDGTPGPLNAITDVFRRHRGHTTLISGEGKTASWQGAGTNGSDRCASAGKRFDEPIRFRPAGGR